MEPQQQNRKLLDSEAGALRALGDAAEQLAARRRGLLEGLQVAEEMLRGQWEQIVTAAAARVGVDPRGFYVDLERGVFTPHEGADAPPAAPPQPEPGHVEYGPPGHSAAAPAPAKSRSKKAKGGA